MSALGIGFDSIFVNDINVPARPFCFVVNMVASRSEAGNKNVGIHLIDADGKDVIPVIRGNMQLSPPPTGLKMGTGLVINFNNVKFPSYGSYTISFVVDGAEYVSLPLTISRPPKSQ